MFSGKVLAVVAALAVVIGGPFLLRAVRGVERADPTSSATRTLVIVTPHVPQIQQEFGAAFARWHKRVEVFVVRARPPGGMRTS